MQQAKAYLQKPVEIEAFQFEGWQNAEEICDWLPGTFYVPQGYDHRLRPEGEHDNSTGHVLGQAPSFLLITVKETLSPKEFPHRMRVDHWDWIVRDKAGRVVIIRDAEFKRLYDLKPGESNA